MTEENNRTAGTAGPEASPGEPRDTQEQDEYAQLIRKLKQQVGEGQSPEEDAKGYQPPQSFEVEDISETQEIIPEMDMEKAVEEQKFQPEPQISIGLEPENSDPQQETVPEPQALQPDEQEKRQIDLRKEEPPFEQTSAGQLRQDPSEEPRREDRISPDQTYQNEWQSDAAAAQPSAPYGTGPDQHGGNAQQHAEQCQKGWAQGSQNTQARQKPKNSTKPNDRIFQLRYRMSIQDWDRINDRERKHLKGYKTMQILGYVLGGLVLLLTFIAGISDAVNAYEYYSYGYSITVNFDVFGILLGLLLVLFPVFMRSSMKKNVKKSYMSTPSFRSDMTLNFYEGYVEQISVSSKTAYRWGYIDSFQETAEAFMIYTLKGPQNQGFFIPKSSLTPQDMMMLDRVFSYLSGKYQKIYLKNFL
ncbi:YcxB family protein [Candidatus Soleaferrea massiliensis]|uniref:YcxB family protein n=1 Tax=Candidatus Soleaferrea massiliensis TaxID=1470354 RepID=UPI0005916705|nr:YcxB family protein [Candidatus Soleaferrea massiliensis]